MPIFFDGLFADWAVLERIEQAGARMRETRGRIGDVLEVLRTRRTAAEAELAQAQKRRDEYITQAKM